MKYSLALLAALAAFTLSAEVTVAHGPCDCLFPVVGQPGASVTVASGGRVLKRRLNWPAYKVIFNPRPSAFGTSGSDSGYASAYQAEAPTTKVFSRSYKHPVRGARFRVPRSARSGLYLVMIFDGSEGGQHYTWDYFHVLGPSPQSSSEPGPIREGDSDIVPALLGAGLATLAIGVLGWSWRRFRRVR